jgi:hypothetical protein
MNKIPMKQKPIILIDEYDSLIRGWVEHPNLSENEQDVYYMCNFVNRFITHTLKTSSDLYWKAVMFGILPINFTEPRLSVHTLLKIRCIHRILGLPVKK